MARYPALEPSRLQDSPSLVRLARQGLVSLRARSPQGDGERGGPDDPASPMASPLARTLAPSSPGQNSLPVVHGPVILDILSDAARYLWAVANATPNLNVRMIAVYLAGDIGFAAVQVSVESRRQNG
ncbi:MAG: hypothetical protein ACE5MM_11095 [Nitrospiraceae bacterium]